METVETNIIIRIDLAKRTKKLFKTNGPEILLWNDEKVCPY